MALTNIDHEVPGADCVTEVEQHGCCSSTFGAWMHQSETVVIQTVEGFSWDLLAN
ncbi:hypothetical protein [Petrocella atlantisensis]|uniref:hypothetical protein n=1 Tax=Petrocella atlantisensis TaxID=2173034 RepID=UPI001558F507|nr:hypothetical protein [Petrocella atlantisensis]MCF8018132.1 hypothetical protein [Vallitaleaceae bacterium]